MANNLSCRRHGPVRRLSFCCLVVLAAVAAVDANAAELVRRMFDLPADAAEKSLRRFSVQSGLQVIFPTAVVQGVRTRPVKGEFPSREALDRMIANTVLKAIYDEKTGALTITRDARQRPSPAPPSSSFKPANDISPQQTPMKRKNPITMLGTWLAVTLASTQAAESTGQGTPPNPALPKNDEPVVLSIFQVTTDKDEGYRSSQTVSGSRTLANLRDTPASISILNRELLDDLIVTKILEAMAFGVTGEIDTNSENANETFVFRGIPANLRLRNGVTWFGGVGDTYNVERVELLRGPQAFLYGEGTAGGLPNTLTKQAHFRDFQRANVILGSYDTHRVELDINRKLGKKFAVRLALAYGRDGSFQNHVERKFYGAYATVNWRPFKNTNINIDAEYRFNDGVMGSNMLADGFSITPVTGASTALTATTGGRTFIPALGLSYDSVGLRRSTGTNLVLVDESILPREFNFLGRNAPRDSMERAAGVHVDQKIGENFDVQGSFTYFYIKRWNRQRVGSSSAAVFRDLNPTLPGGMPNPYYNELYTEFYNRRLMTRQPVRNVRVTAVYDWKLPFTNQKVVGSAVYHDAEPRDTILSEFVDETSSNFKGALNPESTLAAYANNVSAMQQNFFYRRFYLKDGDRAELTNGRPIPGQSMVRRDVVADGAAGRLADRLYQTPAYGFGADGAYFNGRIHTLIGWRRSFFTQDNTRDFYNPVTEDVARLAPSVHTRIEHDAYTYGVVGYLSKQIGAYYNYAESNALSSGFGGAMLTPGQVRGPQLGEGHEYGLRLAFLDGRLESNWSYYVNMAQLNNVNPAIPVAVRQTELGSIFGAEIDSAGGDTQSTRTSGLEVETVANLTKNWRLTLNFATNDLETSERYPHLKRYQALARERNIPTPETDEFLSSAPDGTPLPGFTKRRFNLVTMYRITNGPLRNFSFGGGVQIRGKSYKGNFDRDRDGVAEELWSAAYDVWSLMTSYRTKIWNRNVDFSLNIYNLFDKDYFRSFALNSGAWGDPRTFRFAARFDL